MSDKDFQSIDPEFKIKMTVEYLEMRVERLSEEQLDALYKRLLEVEDGNIIIPEA